MFLSFFFFISRFITSSTCYIYNTILSISLSLFLDVNLSHVSKLFMKIFEKEKEDWINALTLAIIGWYVIISSVLCLFKQISSVLCHSYIFLYPFLYLKLMHIVKLVKNDAESCHWSQGDWCIINLHAIINILFA